MKALLLAAGYGTRLKPITNSIPKCLVKVNGKPLLDVWLDLLFKSGLIERVLINTHYLSEQVSEHIEKSIWKDFIDIVYESNLLGTAGTLIKNIEWAGSADLFVAHADNLTFFDLEQFIKFHNDRPNFANITMMTFTTDVPKSCGIVRVDEEIVLEFFEKVSSPPSNLANAAVYIFDYQVLHELSKNNYFDISLDIIPLYLGKIVAWHNQVYHRDIGTIQSLAFAEAEVKRLNLKI